MRTKVKVIPSDEDKNEMNILCFGLKMDKALSDKLSRTASHLIRDEKGNILKYEQS